MCFKKLKVCSLLLFIYVSIICSILRYFAQLIYGFEVDFVLIFIVLCGLRGKDNCSFVYTNEVNNIGFVFILAKS